MTAVRLPSDDLLTLTSIELDEGYATALPDGRCMAYPDPLSERHKTGQGHGEPWTIGFGCTGQGIVEGLVWTKAEADAAVKAHICAVHAQLDQRFPWWRAMSLQRQRVMVNMTYNLGIYRLLGFKHFLEAAEAGDYKRAADQMLDSLWARQVGRRAKRLAAMMELG